MSHLCGLCLTLRDEAGQASRALTGYDVLLLSVLVEAQTGPGATERAGPCPLRGMRTAQVVPAANPGARLAAAGSLLAGAAAMKDKVQDRDIPTVAHRAASRWAVHVEERGRALAGDVGLDGGLLARATADAAVAECSDGPLEVLLGPSGRAVAELFAHTAAVAGKPSNREPLRRAGDAFGRLVHLLDAVDDYGSDRRSGRFNPLAATSTPPAEARRLAARLAGTIRSSMAEVEMVDPALASRLLGPVIERSVARHFPETRDRPRPAAARAGAGRAAALGAALSAPVVLLGIFGGGRRRPPFYNDPYGPPPGYGYGYRRRGPSCCDLLACDCCANMACNDCCGGDDDCCVCCC